MAGFNKCIANKSESHDRFWSKVDKSNVDGCWLWGGSKHTGGYGLFRRNGVVARCHRVSWELSNGTIPSGMHVLHHCDTPACVNPSHLFLGSHKDNMDDRTMKNRNPHGDSHPFRVNPSLAARGERIGRSKMTAEMVVQARLDFNGNKATIAQLSRRYGLSHQGMSSIVRGVTWRHILHTIDKRSKHEVVAENIVYLDGTKGNGGQNEGAQKDDGIEMQWERSEL